jgi:hypothetical protein
LGFAAPIAVRLLQLRQAARNIPDVPATAIVEPLMVQVLARRQKTDPATDPPAQRDGAPPVAASGYDQPGGRLFAKKSGVQPASGFGPDGDNRDSAQAIGGQSGFANLTIGCKQLRGASLQQMAQRKMSGAQRHSYPALANPAFGRKACPWMLRTSLSSTKG